MKLIGDAIARGRLAMAGGRSPWGGGDAGDKPADQSEDAGKPGSSDKPVDDGKPATGDAPRGPRNPWLPSGETPPPPRRSARIEDIFSNRPDRRPGGNGGGGKGNFPRLPERAGGKTWFPLIMGGIALLWLAVTCAHMVGPKEEGLVTLFGKYSRTITPGVSLTMPWPIENVEIRDVTSIKIETIPSDENEKLMLTGDQNLVDFSYLVRWNIKNLKLFTFQLDDAQQTVREVAEAAMRASVAEVPLTDVIGGAGRAQIEQSTRVRMQAVLDAYRSGVQIQGVEIKKADPPSKVNSAFQQVNAAQQDAERAQSQARAWAQQLIAQAQGEASSFDKVYAQYKLAPEVTKRRMYYETMENVLNQNDKVIVEAQGVTPYLPLPEIKRRQAAPTGPTATVEGAQ